MQLIEALKSLESVLDAEQKRKYFELLKKWLAYSSPITKLQFNEKVRKILKTPVQIQKHNILLFSFLSHVNVQETKILAGNNKGLFEAADTSRCSTSTNVSALPKGMEYRSAEAELFVPDLGFLSNKIAMHAWENGLDGAEPNVAQTLLQACQAFVQNIVTAMVSRKMGYKIRNGNFQHGFGVPVPDPFLPHTSFATDNTQECKVEVADDSFVPAFRPTLEAAEAETIFLHACAHRSGRTVDKRLDMKLLYHTLRENPSIIGFNSIHSLHMLKASLALEDL